MSSTQQLTRISVALATYNGARHLQEQLTSLAGQTLPPLELVVTDDGSTDNTLDLLQAFRAEVSFPVRVFSNEQRLGYSENFLKAASLCTSSLIAFCDQDDVWEKEKLARCAATFQDPEVVLCLHTAAVWDGATTSGHLYPEIPGTTVFLPPALDPFKLVPGFAMVFRSDLLRITNNSPRPPHMLGLGPNPTSQAHDTWIWFLATTTGKVATIADSLALYRQHGNNAVGAPPETTAKRTMALAVADFQYAAMANLEAVYASIAQDLSSRLPSPRREYALATSRNLLLRSKCHRFRSNIYAPGSNFFRRTFNFLRLVTVGAYRNDPSKARLGVRAGLKDLCLGVPGAHRWIARETKP